VATGESYSVRNFLNATAALLDIDAKHYVEYDQRYLRPTEVDSLIGDAGKARDHLGWRPKTSFQELVSMMVAHDHELASQERTLIDAGHRV
jgi:GDPmannose 4,6-dehydratase